MSQVFGVRRFIEAPLNLFRKVFTPPERELPDPDKQKSKGGRIGPNNKCGRVGHRWRFVSSYGIRRGSAMIKGGVFSCARCGKQDLFPIKNKHGDKINVRRSERPKSQGGTMLPAAERKAA